MKKLVCENLEEYLATQNIDEGLIDSLADFFKSMRQLVTKALKNPTDEKIVNNAIGACFSRKTKEYILTLTLEEKIIILKRASKELQNNTIGILKLSVKDGKYIKDKEGYIVKGYKVVAGEVAGNAAGVPGE